jgi:sugar O-acyltransferase (sialic acid O-acetyltransferase NeuD family)
MTSNLLIISAGSYAREVYSWALDCIAAGAPWAVSGFLDDRPDALASFPCAVGIISPLEEYEPQPNDLFVCAIGDPGTRKRYVEKAKRKGFRFANLIHPSAVVGQNVRMGEGVILAPFVVLTADVEVGNFVNIGCMSGCSHHNKIGDWCQISGNCGLTGRVVLEEGVFVGCGATFVPGCQVGAWAYVGAGSVVLRRVKTRTKVFGNPAVQIGTVDEAPESV